MLSSLVSGAGVDVGTGAGVLVGAAVGAGVGVGVGSASSQSSDSCCSIPASSAGRRSGVSTSAVSGSWSSVFFSARFEWSHASMTPSSR